MNANENLSSSAGHRTLWSSAQGNLVAVAETWRRVWGTENFFGGPKISE